MKTRTRIVVGVSLTVAVFALLILFVGVERFVDTITSVDPLIVLAIFAIICLRRVSQGTVLYIAFNRFGVDVSLPQAVFISASTSFANNVTPFAQLGGEPLAAGIVADAVREPYERCLAAISTIDTIRFVPTTTVFVLGSVYFALLPAPIPEAIKPLFALFGVFLLAICLLAVVIWKYQERAERLVAGVIVRLLAFTTVVPYAPTFERADVRERVRGFASLFVDLTTDPRLVAGVTTFSFLSLVLTVFELWLALRAVGVSAPIVVVLFAVPFSQLASIVPSPGGVGGIEAVLVLFISTLTGNAVAGVTTGVILSSGAGYWVTMTLGGLGISVVLPMMSDSYDGSALP